MIDYSHLEKYRENNRLEAKTALGGLPESLWETYSAFANTLGGVILLGVVETEDKTFRAVGLPDPEGLISDFKSALKSGKKVSADILSEDDIVVHETDGKRFVSVNVPQADRKVKPIYIDGDPRQVYRRNGEGDYKCTDEEYAAMVRDSGEKTQDLGILEDMSLRSFCADTVQRYMERVAVSRAGGNLKRKSIKASELAAQAEGMSRGTGDAETAISDFLLCVGAADVGSDSGIYPTLAGLLMFGNLRDIRRKYPDYSLEYQERGEDGSITYRISTSERGSDASEFSGNLYDFYLLAGERLCAGIRRDAAERAVSEDAAGGNWTAARVGHAGGKVSQAVLDALVNCLVNADYYGSRGILVVRKKSAVTFSNPGGFRIKIDAAKSGGISDPRNSAVLKMFTLAGAAENSGRGLKNIFSVWNEQGMNEPLLEETFEPERVKLSLSFSDSSGVEGGTGESGSGESSAEGSSAEGSAAEGSSAANAVRTKKLIIDYLTYHVTGVLADLADYAGVSGEEANRCLEELVSEGFVVSGLERGKIRYKLKS
ncbi:MAG: RNA-binding domain-containing protein [Eubacterium sp.]|jgi:ATP-dependent DNA helicase RecG